MGKALLRDRIEDARMDVVYPAQADEYEAGTDNSVSGAFRQATKSL